MLFRSYKGLSRGASRTVRTALRLAGQQGCTTADTGHLLLAMLQTAQGPAADFLRRKRVTTASLTEAAPKRSGTGQPHRLRKNDLSSDSRKAIEFAILGAHASSAAKAENEHLLCAMLEGHCLHGQHLAGGRRHRGAPGRAGVPPAFRPDDTARTAPDEHRPQRPPQ